MKFLFLLVLIANSAHHALADSPTDRKAKAEKLQKDGNYAEAFPIFQELALATDTPGGEFTAEVLSEAGQCLNRLNRQTEIAPLLEEVIAAHPEDFWVLRRAANEFRSLPHYGFIVAGEFERGNHRGGGRQVSAIARDRVRVMQLLLQALALPNLTQQQQLYVWRDMATALQQQDAGAWRLQVLTDISTLPDYDDLQRGFGYGTNPAAACDADGNPIFYATPANWDAASNDGERWRFAIEQIRKSQPREADYRMATFSLSQFGVQTLANSPMPFGRAAIDEEAKAGIFSLQTLKDDETIARLASGVKRFRLPADYNYILLFKALSDKGTYDLGACESLAQIHQNRRQYPEAATWWQKAIHLYPKDNDEHRRRQLEQITGNWGSFDPVQAFPAGTNPQFGFLFRNATGVTFTARRIKIDTLLGDIQEHLRSNPDTPQDDRVNAVRNLGHFLIEKNRARYLGGTAAEWKVKLDPLPDHFDRRMTVTAPLTEAGAYWLTAKLADGNETSVVLFLNDTVIVDRPLDKQRLVFVADARDGHPIASAEVTFFGFHLKQIERKSTPSQPHYETTTKTFTRRTNAEGQVILDKGDIPDSFEWLIIARTDAGRLAFDGFQGMWFPDHHDREYNETKSYIFSDRPVYRPEQTVQWKAWIRHAQYDKENTSDFAGRKITLRIHNPQGDKIFEKEFTADAFGGISGEFPLPKDAMLGVYRISTNPGNGQGAFRVEEYKKPEFEVTVDAPEKPVMLGEKIEVKIAAKYYFGAPVTEATVKYKVLRHPQEANWYPPSPWDWFYGPGYWWFYYDTPWFPGWARWGCLRPYPFWWPRIQSPPEVVAEAEVPIGADGTVAITIDTALAKEMHGDSDHRYEITAEVTDQSRRTIVGTGKVLVAREPFKVYAWTDRGHYRVGDTIGAEFAARTPDGKPVQGRGELTLFAISYTDGKPNETPVQTWQMNTDTQGRARQQIQAAKSGQFRLALKVDDGLGHSIEGGQIIVVRGDGFSGDSFRFNALELIPDKKDYKAGETVRLLVNTDRVGSNVLLFLRPSNGVYLPPVLLHLDGKSTVHEVAVTRKDMPNFFIEAITVADARVHEELRDIAVPPEDRILNVTVTPSATEFEPNQKATIHLNVLGPDGLPHAGTAVVAVYDRALDYIAGGVTPPDIREFFWKWRRTHHPSQQSSFDQEASQDLAEGASKLQPIGVFGSSQADDFSGDRRTPGGLSESGGTFGYGFNSGFMDNSGPIAGRASVASMSIMEKAMGDKDAENNDAADTGPEIAVRSNFADTALWVSVLDVKDDGTAEVSLDMPENLTAWKVRTWALAPGTMVGGASTELTTSKKLLVRLQTPRFLTEKDEVVISANIHNDLDQAEEVKATLELGDVTLAVIDGKPRTVRIEPKGEVRVDWRVRATREGEATVTVKAVGATAADAMKMHFPVQVHGMSKTDSISAALRPEETTKSVTVTVPAERRPADSRLEIRFSPTLAGAMVDALPYLAEYPYGCTEQTLNRFVPTVITQRILERQGIDLKAVRDKRANLNAQEIGDPAQRATRWQHWKRNPVFDRATVDDMVREGLRALTAMQLSDGGWGWFSGRGEQSWPHTTATVVSGLLTAKANGVAVNARMLENGIEWLDNYQAEQVRRLQLPQKSPRHRDSADNTDALVYSVLAEARKDNDEMRAFLYRDREHLSVYAKALTALAFHRLGHNEQRDMLIRNVRQFLREDDENQTAWLELGNGGYWWCWYGSEFEAQATFLRLLAATDPKGETASRLAKYLINNRKHATYWNSTRDTAMCIEALAEFLTASGESAPDLDVEILVDGKVRKSVKINKSNLFDFDSSLVLDGEAVTTGKHMIEFRKKGIGPLYTNAYLTVFSLEDLIGKAGLEVKVERRFYKLEPVDKEVAVRGNRGQVVNQKVEKFRRVPLESGAVLASGDLVEVELEIESKNDYEYLIFEDMKAAGMEAVEVRSGYNGNDMGAYIEFRDNRVALFVHQLARGKHSVAYRLRAEIPGTFSALPAKANGMYAPELRANSDEMKIGIQDQ